MAPPSNVSLLATGKCSITSRQPVCLALLDPVRQCHQCIFTVGIDYNAEGSILVTPTQCAGKYITCICSLVMRYLYIHYARCRLLPGNLKQWKFADKRA